jgi:hypothetical protein
MRLLLAALLLIAAETAAFACSCMRPSSPEEVQRLARDVAQGAIALVEVDVLSAYDRRRSRGEQVRVRRVLAGRAPRSFEVERLNFPSSASCDLAFTRGHRTTLILYPAQQRSRTGTPRYRISGLCTSHLMEEPRFQATVRSSIRS